MNKKDIVNVQKAVLGSMAVAVGVPGWLVAEKTLTILLCLSVWIFGMCLAASGLDGLEAKT